MSFIVAVAAVGWFGMRDTEFVSRLYAVNHYNVPSEEVEVLGRPHDCDFMTAPLGAKHCRYERQYMIEWMTLSDNVPLVYGSYQEDPPTECSERITDFTHRCYFRQLKPGEHPVANEWRPRHIQVHWRKAEE